MTLTGTAKELVDGIELVDGGEMSDELDGLQELVDGFDEDAEALCCFCTIISSGSGSIGNDRRRF